jgi:nitrogen fixation protein FixH
MRDFEPNHDTAEAAARAALGLREERAVWASAVRVVLADEDGLDVVRVREPRGAQSSGEIAESTLRHSA